MKIAEGFMNVEEGTTPSFTFLENPYNIEIVSATIDIDGIVEVTINQDILNPSMSARYYLSDSVPKYIIANSGGALNVFYVFRKNLDGTFNNNQLQGLFEIHTLEGNLPIQQLTYWQKVKKAIAILKTII